MKILVSGLVNVETNVKVKEFPIPYFPIDYPFFGVSSCVSGVALNIAKALKTLGDDVMLATILGKDAESERICNEIKSLDIPLDNVNFDLHETPCSVALFDENGKRQIYCDLKDMQEHQYNSDTLNIDACDLVVACNINFNRALLKKAKQSGKKIATDVHVLSDINDEYNRDFMEYADILFLSDECIKENHKDFVSKLKDKFPCEIIVVGEGAKGALMYVRSENRFYEVPAVKAKKVVNTIGAGDALFSAFIHFYTKGLPAFESLKRAQCFASYKIGYNGAAIGFATEKETENMARNI